jgi:cobalamin synthase
MDTCDGLSAAGLRTQTEIMKDLRVGAFGVAGGALALLLKYTALRPSIFGLLLSLKLGPVGNGSRSCLPCPRKRTGRDERSCRLAQIILATCIALITIWFTSELWD